MKNQATVAYFWEKITTISDIKKLLLDLTRAVVQVTIVLEAVWGLHSSSFQVLRYRSGSVFLGVRGLSSGMR